MMVCGVFFQAVMGFRASRQPKKYIPFADWRASSPCSAASLRQLSGASGIPGKLRKGEVETRNSAIFTLHLRLSGTRTFPSSGKERAEVIVARLLWIKMWPEAQYHSLTF